MNVGALALKALEWIGRVVGLVKSPIGKEFTRTILGKVLGDRAPRYMAALARLEQTVGAHTSAWPKIEAAAENNTELVLTAEEADYLNRFKRVWDRNIKRPMDRAAIKLQAVEPTPDELVIVSTVNEILAEEPDENVPEAP